MPSWMAKPEVDVPLFISRRRLAGRRSAPRALTRWALDSGGFSELSMYGEWRTTHAQYVGEVRRWVDECGKLDWVAPMDWMCEPWILEKTGLSVEEHQRRTTASVLRLREALSGVARVIPVLQGWRVDDYQRHADAYEAAGLDLSAEHTVGVGSVCRRQALGEAEVITSTLHARGIALHGFGMKRGALQRYGRLLRSADSMAWSYAGRRRPSPWCSKRTCANCLHYALEWREAALEPPRQLNLFGSFAA